MNIEYTRDIPITRALVARSRELAAHAEHELDPLARFSRIDGELYGFRYNPETETVHVRRGPTDSQLRAMAEVRRYARS